MKKNHGLSLLALGLRKKWNRNVEQNIGLRPLLFQDAVFLNDKPFSAVQATDFVQHWSVVSGGHQPNMPSGFSATLFQGKADSGDLAGQ